MLNEELEMETKNQVESNISKWQSLTDPLAPLTDAHNEIIFQLEDTVKALFCKAIKTDVQVDPLIHTNYEFVRWMIKVENEVKQENMNDYLSHYNRVRNEYRICEDLLDIVEKVGQVLNDLKTKYQQVIANISSLYVTIDTLLSQHKDLQKKKEIIQEYLQHFTAYEILNERINNFAHNINSTELKNILNQIDSSLAYVNKHSNYKESCSYRIKLENLLLIVFNRVTLYFSQLLTATTNEVLNFDSDQGVELVTNSTLLYYGKFQNVACKIAPLLTHFEQNVAINASYRDVLANCQKIYFTKRSSIIIPSLLTGLGDLKCKYKHQHSMLFRSGCLFTLKVCQDELKCFQYFFTQISEELNIYLQAVSQNLYDILRPVVISINHIEILSELCVILKEISQGNEVTIKAFSETSKQLLQDLKERLVFRANAYFQELASYKPSPGDLAYPEKIQQLGYLTEINEKTIDSKGKDSDSDSVQLLKAPIDFHGMWYPTVKKTLICLSILYFALDKDVFQSLGQEVLIICLQTLESATKGIITRNGPLDGCLFQIKHLLILREQVAPFQFSSKANKASSISAKNMASTDLVKTRSTIFTMSSTNAILDFLLGGTSKDKECLIDSRKEMDKQLKASCEVFISHATNMLIGDLTKWMKNVKDVLKIMNLSDEILIPLKNRDFAKPENVANVILNVQKNIKMKILDIKKSLKLYLANKETENILFKPIRNNILHTFVQLEHMLVIANYSEDDRLIIACPTPDQVNVLICSICLISEEVQNQSQK